MQLEIVPSTEKTEVLEKRVQERTEEKLEKTGVLRFKAEETDVPELVTELSHLPGIKEIIPHEECNDTPEDIIDKLEEMFENKKNFIVKGRDISGELEKSSIFDEESEDLELVVEDSEDGKVKIHSESYRGSGGEPVDFEDIVVLKFEDRMDALAGVLLTLEGRNVIPVYTGKNPDEVDEGIKTLREYNPRVKLVVLEEYEIDEALENTADLYGAEDIAEGSLEDKENGRINPVKAETEEEALEIYGKYMSYRTL